MYQYERRTHINFSVEAMVHGYDEYQNAFAAPIGEILSCERENVSVSDFLFDES